MDDISNNVSAATQKFIKACFEYNIELLHEAIAEGADLNYRDESCASPFDNMVFSFSCVSETEPYTIDDMIKFASVLISNGFDLNYSSRAGVDDVGTFWHVAKWGGSLELLEFLLSYGLNPNYITDAGVSALDELESCIFIEEVGENDSEYAAYLYEAARLSVAYGALPTMHLKKKYKPGEEEWYRAAMRLDMDFYKSHSAEELIEYHADDLVVRHSKYGYPKESYYEIEKLQNMIISVLDAIIAKIGIDNLNNRTLEACVDLQYVAVLEHLLEMGANPYVNCFSEQYKHVKSSAKYTLVKEGHYYKPEARARMNELLADVEY